MVADETWKDAKQNYDEQKVKADALNDKAIQYTITRQEADDSRALYEDLLKRLKEAGILQGLKSSTITAVDQALIPVKPKKPNVPLYLAGALAFGLFLGGAGVLVVDTLDDTVRDASPIEQLGLPLIGVLPRLASSKRAIEVRSNPKSRYSEMVRNLRSVLTRQGRGSPEGDPDNERSSRRREDYAFHEPGRQLCTAREDGIAARGGYEKARITYQHGAARETWTQPSACRRIAGESDLCSSADARALPVARRSCSGLSLRVIGVRSHAGAARAPARRIRCDCDRCSPRAAGRRCAGAKRNGRLTIQLARFGVTTKTALIRAHDLLTAYSRRPVGIVLNGVAEGSGAYHDYYGYRDFDRWGKARQGNP